MSSVFERSLDCAWQITKRFNDTGEAVEVFKDERLGVNDIVFTSARYRRAHISIVDARETKKVWMLHVTVFPHLNDPSPIYGFDIVAGPSKVSGAFHDFSSPGYDKHPMFEWFENHVSGIEWNKPRPLPEWASVIFSKNIVAIGAVGEEELADFIKLGLNSLDYYLDNVGKTQQDIASYDELQDLYCRQQRLNPHTPRVLVNLGFTEEEAKDFVQNNLFPLVV